MTTFHHKNKNPGQPAFEEAAPPEVLERVKAISIANKLDAEERGKLLHHINGCPICFGMMGIKKGK